MIIDSLLDTDLYKLTMMQYVLHQHPAVRVKYKFKCRTPDIYFPMIKIINEIQNLNRLRINHEEIYYLQSLKIFSHDFIQFLMNYRLDTKYISISGQDITIEGPWLHTILFEVPILAIISECYYDDHKEGDVSAFLDLEDINWADFGTRRRRSKKWHHKVLEETKPKATSNVYMAMKHDIPPVGTIAHEVFQVSQALAHPLDCNEYTIRSWLREYGKCTALTDTLGVDKFLNDLTPDLFNACEGFRQDSGDPVEVFEKFTDRYDMTNKKFVFSDGLDPAIVLDIHRQVDNRAIDMYGIGTNLMNGFDDQIQIVIKVVEANNRPVAKLTSGKEMCDDEDYVRYLKKSIQQTNVA